MLNLPTAVFFSVIFNYAILIPLGAALGSAVIAFFQFVILAASILSLGIILILLAWLFLKADSMERI